MAMNAYAIPPAISCLAIFCIGVFLLTKRHTSHAATILSVFCFSIVVWLLGFTGMYLTDDAVVALQRVRFGFLGVAFIPILAFHFVVTFLEKKCTKTLVALYALIIPAVCISQTPLIYKDVKKFFWGFYPLAGTLYPLFVVMFIVLFASCCWLLWDAYQTSKEKGDYIKCNQIKYLLFAFAICSLGVADYLVKFDIAIYPYGYMIVFFFVAMLTYTIVKHRLMGITIAIKISSIIGGIAIFLTGMYLVGIVLAESVVSRYVYVSPVTLRIIVVALIALTLVPFRNIIRKFLLSLFLSREKELEQELDALKRFLMTQIEFEGSVLLLVGELESILRVRCVTILVHDEKVQQYKVETSIGCEENIEGMSRNDVTPLFDWLNEHQRTAVKKWLDDGTNEEMLAAMEHIEAVLCIPMFLDETVRGIIALGEKKWRKYTVDEIQILERFANEIVIVLQNILEVEHKISPPKPRPKNPGYVIRPTPFPGWVIIDDPPPDGKKT